MEQALADNDYELYQELKAQKEQNSKEYRDYLAASAERVRNSMSDEMYQIIYDFAPELDGQTVDQWSEQTLLDIQKRIDDELVEMENSGMQTCHIAWRQARQIIYLIAGKP